jgi:hypothetical protein
VSDYTAIILSEVEKRDDPLDGTLKKHYIVRLIERVPLGSSYQSVVDRCAQLYETLNKRPRFVVDASGARPIYDLFKSANLPLLPIQITAGTASRIEKGYGYVSKLELATLLQVMSSANRIHLPANSKFSNAMRGEARRFELKITDSGNLTFGAEGSHKHDDLIMALTYVLWYGERRGGVDRPRVRWI